MKTYTDTDLIGVLRKRVDALSQKEVSREIGFTAQFVNDVLAGRRVMTVKLATALGFIKLDNRYTRKQGA